MSACCERRDQLLVNNCTACACSIESMQAAHLNLCRLCDMERLTQENNDDPVTDRPCRAGGCLAPSNSIAQAIGDVRSWPHLRCCSRRTQLGAADGSRREAAPRGRRLQRRRPPHVGVRAQHRVAGQVRGAQVGEGRPLAAPLAGRRQRRRVWRGRHARLGRRPWPPHALTPSLWGGSGLSAAGTPTFDSCHVRSPALSSHPASLLLLSAS